MVDEDDDTSKLESRPPTVDDLVALCRELNEAEARYLVVGGMAMLHHGFVRATEDIDLLVATDEDNFERLVEAMRSLPDRAIEEVRPTDLDEFVVVRVADEIVVDLMARACGIDYEEAASERVEVNVRVDPLRKCPADVAAQADAA